VDVWFGPGGIQGAFGAGVARGLHRSMETGEVDSELLRLYGSSVGCLTASYLATGNTDCGLKIFKDDAKSVFSVRNLLPMIAASAINRMGNVVGRRNSLLPVPQVLKVDQAIDIMLRHTPHVVEQLRTATVPVYAEFVDRQSGKYCHLDLRTAADPMRWIRASINHVPFASNSDDRYVDSIVKGYGFWQLPDRGQNQYLVVVLNYAPGRDFATKISSRICAGLCRNSQVAKLYAQRSAQCGQALESISTKSGKLLIVSRPQSCRTIDKSFAEGISAASRVVEFLRIPR
jgi:hypothetical protein